MKKLFTLLMVTMLVLGICTCVASAQQLVDVEINGVDVDFDVPAQVINDRTLVPLRGIFEVVGATVNWDEATETVTAKRGDVEISLAIGSTSLFVNGEEKIIDVPAQLIDDRTLIPARAVAESLGATVDWNDAEQTVIITDATAPDFAALLKMANSEDELISSIDASAGIDFAMTADGEEINFAFDYTMKVVTEPMSYEITANVDTMGEEVAMQMYAKQNDDMLDIYYVADDGTSDKLINKTSVEMPVAKENVELISELVRSIFPDDLVKVAAQEKLGDKDTVKFVSTITGAQLNEVISVFDTKNILAEMGLDDIFAPDSCMKIYEWLDAETAVSYKGSIDLVDTIEGVFESMGIVEGISIDKCSIDMVINSVNTVEEIIIPEEVIENAVEIPVA